MEHDLAFLAQDDFDALFLLHPSQNIDAHVTYRFRFTDDTIWGMRDRGEDEKFRDKPYYGIKGVKRLSNGPIAVFCLLFMALGIFVHVTAIRSGEGLWAYLGIVASVCSV